MDQFSAKIETLEHRFMRAWMMRDRQTMKGLLARDFIFTLGAQRSVILDRPSWLDASTTRLKCEAYRFGEVYVRRHKTFTMLIVPVELEAKMGARDWTGKFWFTDLWQRTKLRRKWQLIERVVTRPEENEELSASVRELQLWR